MAERNATVVVRTNSFERNPEWLFRDVVSRTPEASIQQPASPDLDDVIGVVVIKIPVQIEAACLEG